MHYIHSRTPGSILLMGKIWDKDGYCVGTRFPSILGTILEFKNLTWDNIGTLDWDRTVCDHTPMYFTAGSMLSQEQNSVIPLLSLVYYLLVPIGTILEFKNLGQYWDLRLGQHSIQSYPNVLYSWDERNCCVPNSVLRQGE